MTTNSLQLPHDEAHVWNVETHCSSQALSALLETLSHEEKQRAARYRASVHRDRYVLAHGALRNILSRYAGQSPQDLRFAISASGKPHLMAGADMSAIHFSLSHSADHALVTLSSAGPVGVDIEMINPATEVLAIAERFFSFAEIGALRSVSPAERLKLFFQIWVCKEAYLKARGEGILDRLPTTSIAIDASANASLASDLRAPHAPDTWHLSLLRTTPPLVAAVAVENKRTVVRQFLWDPGDPR